MPRDFAVWVDHVAWITETARSHCEAGDEPRALDKLHIAKAQLDLLLEEFGTDEA